MWFLTGYCSKKNNNYFQNNFCYQLLSLHGCFSACFGIYVHGVSDMRKITILLTLFALFVLISAVALETSKGEFAFAMALGLLLLILALLANLLLRRLQEV